jgi:tetratricopeptide (TPR) repeat protein
VRLVIGRRLARLRDETQKVLGTAAVIGRSFTFELLEASTATGADALLDCIDEAERGGLIASSLQYPEVRFKFAHELIRRAVLDGQSAPRRQRLHSRVAETIEQLYPDALYDHAEDLAHHLWNAGSAADSVRTLKYLHMAGGKAAQRSANLVAINHFKNALKLAGTVPETPERLEQELMLNTALGTALVETMGFSSLEAGEVFSRARELSQRVNETSQLFRVFWGLWVNYAARAQYETGFEMAEQCYKLAQAAGNSGLLLEAHHALAVSCCVAGEFDKGLEHAKQVIAIYNPVDHNGLRFAYGQDPVAACLFHAGSAQWFLGYPDQSAKTTQECITLARRLKHPHTLATATGFGARTYQLSGNLDAVEEYAAETVAVASAHDLRFYGAIGVMFGGWALTRRGRIEEGISQLRSGLDAFRGTGAVLLLPYFSALLAEVYGEIGQASEGLRILDSIDLERDRYWQAELHRLKGELILKQQPGCDRGEHEATAEECFRLAAAIARKQNAKSLELRAAISMSRLRISQGKRSEARQLLAEIFEWFTEGFNTADLQAAKMLLDGL